MTYDEIKVEKYEVLTIGDLELPDNERRILELHPNFSILGRLEEGGVDFEQEISNAKLRITLGKEYEEMLEDEEEMTQDEVRKIEEISAQSRQIFDPVEKTFDDRKRRVTDLRECSRVTLPRPLKEADEANIEMRRNAQNKIIREYREKNVNLKTSEQESNLTVEEKV